MNNILPFDVVRAQLERDTQRHGIAVTASVTRHVKQRLADAADAGSRRIVAASAADVGNAALQRFAELLYELRSDGVLWNVSNAGRILIPMPWSSTRYSEFGLTDTSRRVLRLWYTSTCSGLPPRQHWLVYAGGAWYVNRRMPHHTDALAWLAAHPLTPDAWQVAANALPHRGRKGRR